MATTKSPIRTPETILADLRRWHRERADQIGKLDLLESTAANLRRACDEARENLQNARGRAVYDLVLGFSPQGEEKGLLARFSQLVQRLEGDIKSEAGSILRELEKGMRGESPEMIGRRGETVLLTQEDANREPRRYEFPPGTIWPASGAPLEFEVREPGLLRCFESDIPELVLRRAVVIPVSEEQRV